MNKFYDLPLAVQWVISIAMLLVGCLVFYFWFEMIQLSIFGFLLIFIMTPIFQFLIAPLMTHTGVYKYLSPMLLVYSPSKEKYDLHNGTSFDYLFLYPEANGGIQWQNRMLYHYITGLLAVIALLEQDELPDTVEVRGSSYFLSEQTIHRLGFESKPAGTAEKFNILINYLDLVWMYSISKGKLSFPKLKNIRTATTSGKRLMENKLQFLRIQNYLERR